MTNKNAGRPRTIQERKLETKLGIPKCTPQSTQMRLRRRHAGCFPPPSARGAIQRQHFFARFGRPPAHSPRQRAERPFSSPGDSEKADTPPNELFNRHFIGGVEN